MIALEELLLHVLDVACSLRLEYGQTTNNLLLNFLFAHVVFILFIDEWQREVGNVDAVKPGLNNMEGLTLRQYHQDALHRLEQVLALGVLLHHLDSDVHEGWTFDQLDEGAQLD